MTEHIAIYSMACEIRLLQAELNRCKIPQYRMNNLEKLLRTMSEKLKVLLENHDCARCEKLRNL